MKPDRLSKVLSEREVPGSLLIEEYYRRKDLPMEEQIKLREALADRVEREFPYLPGKGPKEE